jgi:hypothetical protein
MSDPEVPFEGGEAPCSECAVGSPDAQAEPAAPRAEGPSPAEELRAEGVPPGDLNDLMGQIPPEMLAPDLPVLLASMATMLEEQAWRHLGLVAHPVTRKVEKDLQKAKIAIDVVAYISSQVSPLLGDSQRRDLQNKVSTLQMNFVEQSRRN